MAKIEPTSYSLIRDIKGDPASPRWSELYRRYEGPMRAFLAARYPSLEADDIIQETMGALARRMPGYRYAPDENGHFRNYLAGILRHKAADAIARRSREADAVKTMSRQAPVADAPGAEDEEDAEWRKSALRIAISRLFADPAVNQLHLTVFRRTALNGEKPSAVAGSLGISRANVDQIKKRLVERLAAETRRLLEE